jgi:hypothetical protein
MYYVISIFKFYVSIQNFKSNKVRFFKKFVVHELNFKMVRYEIMVLTVRERADANSL